MEISKFHEVVLGQSTDSFLRKPAINFAISCFIIHLLCCLLYDIDFLKSPEIVPFINSYLDADDVLKCAASIRIEGAAINLVKSMSGKDPSSIMGLPLLKVIEYLEKFEVKVLSK